MLAIDLIKYLEKWAPPAVAWEKDNIGIQIGCADSEINGIFLTLELNEKALNQAIKKECNFVFTHHPLIFKPIVSLNFTSDKRSRLIRDLIKKDILLYSAHTNLDFATGGVSFELAGVLGLNNVEFLERQSSNQFKLVVFVPADSLNGVAESIFKAGGGIIGEYADCSFRLKGEGTFKGSAETNPAIGKKENFEKVEEIRLEVLVDQWKINGVISNLLKSHPYEEPAFDIYPLRNENVNFGFGAIGDLHEDMEEDKFLEHVSRVLNIHSLKYCKGSKKIIKRVAVCGGSGSELLSSALNKNADAFVTADIKYHTFQDAEDKILMIDAGHYETEIHSLKGVKRKIEAYLKEKSEKIPVHIYSGSTNPIRIYNN